MKDELPDGVHDWRTSIVGAFCARCYAHENSLLAALPCRSNGKEKLRETIRKSIRMLEEAKKQRGE